MLKEEEITFLKQKDSPKSCLTYWWAIIVEGFAFNFSDPSSQY